MHMSHFIFKEIRKSSWEQVYMNQKICSINHNALKTQFDVKQALIQRPNAWLKVISSNLNLIMVENKDILTKLKVKNCDRDKMKKAHLTFFWQVQLSNTPFCQT